MINYAFAFPFRLEATQMSSDKSVLINIQLEDEIVFSDGNVLAARIFSSFSSRPLRFETSQIDLL
jgi:hypothetical protein